MSRGVACKNSASTPSFQNGITNGAAWYPLTGGMQDYNYVWFGCYEVTLEISCCKFPPAHELKKYWTDNQLSMVKFLAEAHRGVQGFVSDQNGAPIEKASMKIKGRDVGFLTTKYGEFWRILLPGVYKLEVCGLWWESRNQDRKLRLDYQLILSFAGLCRRLFSPRNWVHGGKHPKQCFLTFFLNLKNQFQTPKAFCFDFHRLRSPGFFASRDNLFKFILISRKTSITCFLPFCRLINTRHCWMWL